MKALNLLRSALHYRKECFDKGLSACGFKVVPSLPHPTPDDVLVVWNRYGGYNEMADKFERAGAKVIVAENGWLSKSWRGGDWFALSLSEHGMGWPDGGPSRWDSWGVELAPFRTSGSETVILGQRGIGSRLIGSPSLWAESAQRKYGGRIRPHPGTGEAIPLEVDLKDAKQVITWASGAALIALMLGIPVWNALPQWVGARAAKPLTEWPGDPARDRLYRIEMFQHLAWGMWTLEEIKTGEPFGRLLGR